MMSTIGRILLLAFSMGYVLPGAAMEAGTDRPGLDYHSFDLSSPSPALCQRSCEADSRCKAWTYVKPGVQGPGARCWLKHSVPRAYSNDCCVSGVKGSVSAGRAPPAAAASADCSRQREHYDRRCGEMRNYYSGLNCQRHGYSGCALDVAGCFTPYLPGHVFTDQACARPGFISCASEGYDNYVDCLASCNKDAIDGRLPEGRTACAQRCQRGIENAVRSCSR